MPGKAKEYGKTMRILTQILKRLYFGEVLSVKELAEEYEVDPRTIQRYFNKYLKDAGFPLKKIGRRWALDKERLGLIEDEESRLALEALEEIAKKMGSDFYHKVRPYFKKLHTAPFNPFYTKLDMEDLSDKMDEIALLEEGIKERRIITCDYQFEEKIAKDITLKPVRIANFEGYWYLLALDARNDIFKKYYLKHLTNVKLLDETFTIDGDLQKRIHSAINVWFDPDAETIEVVLFADRIAAKYLKRRPLSPTMHISGEDSDGSCEVRLTITNDMEIIPFIKQWMPHILIIEPKWIKKRIESEIKKFLKLLQTI